MKKRVVTLFLIIILIVTGCNNTKNIDKKMAKNETVKNEVISNLIVKINGKEYNLVLESNETVQDFINILPLELKMSELNGNEKYAYLDKSLRSSSFNPKTINKGDVMLFGDNCLVIFYKTFETSYSYTKIGHIDNIDDLGNSDITVKIER